MKNKFKILDTGNFYFPVMDKGKRFIVKETIDINLNKRDMKLICKYKELTKELQSLKGDIDFRMLADPIWKAVKKYLKEDKNCWVVPIRLYKRGESYICTVDILKL